MYFKTILINFVAPLPIIIGLFFVAKNINKITAENALLFGTVLFCFIIMNVSALINDYQTEKASYTENKTTLITTSFIYMLLLMAAVAELIKNGLLYNKLC